MNRASALVATLFGIGYLPGAPGTLASAVALPLAWFVLARSGTIGLLACTAIATLIGTYACELYSRAQNKVDPSECVIDELAGQWLACAFAPLSLKAFATAFALFRLFDIVKPWPIMRAERLPGGYGIMADDLLAGLLAGIIVAVAARLGLV
jgi:phosphatidylglycerophosphatase A